MAVVFTDAYTVGANIDIASYPSGAPDYAYNAGSTLTVNAANDRVQNTSSTEESAARITDGSVPTGDQEISATCQSESGTDETGAVVARCATGGTFDCYICYLDMALANEVNLYRVDAGTYTLLASADRGITATGSGAFRLRATGTTTVALECQIRGTTQITASDSSASRKTSGPPGVFAYNATANLVWVDDVSVDDLAAAGGNIVVPYPPRGCMGLLGVGT